MKSVNKMKDKKHKNVKKTKVKNKKEKILVVAQEIKFARLLSGNEKKTRDRVLKTLKKWLMNCFSKGYEFKEDDFLRVWKGLFYAVWMSDKPLVQEDLCEAIASILDLFPPEEVKHALLMTKAGFKVLANEWYGIDHHRLDKFLMLVRRYLRGSLRCLRRCGWSTDSCRLYSNMLSGADGILSIKTPHYARNAGSMLMHVVDCFLEELAKVSEGKIPEMSVAELLRPFCVYTCGGESPSLCISTRRLLTALLRQSDEGLEYQNRTRAWERMGCPRGGPDALELASDEEDEDMPEEPDDEENEVEKPLDPRAGRVDVELATIPVPAAQLAAVLRELLATASSKAHKRVKICLDRFEQLAKHVYPLRVEDVYRADDEDPVPRARASARQLHALDRALVQSADDLALRGLSRKHRKRLLAKTRAGLSIVDDVPTNTSTIGNWEVSMEHTVKKDDKQIDSSNKENVHKHSKKRQHPETSSDKHKKKQKLNQEEGQKRTTDKKEKETRKSYEKATAANNSNKKKKAEKMLNGTQETNVAAKNNSDKVNVPTVDRNKKNKDKSNEPSKVIKKHKSLKENDVKTVKDLTKNEKFDKKDNKKVVKTTDKLQNGKKPTLTVNKVKNYQKKIEKDIAQKNTSYETPKKVKFALKNNSMQGAVEYYKSIRQSPNIPFDSSKKPTKTNLKPSTPSPINPFFKKKLRLK